MSILNLSSATSSSASSFFMSAATCFTISLYPSILEDIMSTALEYMSTMLSAVDITESSVVLATSGPLLIS